MDIRFFNFLARQPSARLLDRSSFCGLPKRGIAMILVQAMFWQPLLAQADGIVVSGTTNTTAGQAGNGVPIINIAAPNANGLSHNQYQHYNVGSQGVILNNATHRTQSTQMGGIILGNQNLNGRPASIILNEVLGANASQLNGYTEVAGQSARVIVANQYGISCNGCGFINTPRVTLTTGKPMFDNGRLDHFSVNGGSVSIDGAGLSADNVDQFDLITRSAKINAELHAKKLSIVTGRNNVDAQSLSATALADDGRAKPQLAIDSSALGGMYAGAIRLVGTETGVGVKLAGHLAASGGDIQIAANGHLTMSEVAANGTVNVEAASAEIQGAMYGNSVNVQARGAVNVQQNIAARDRISLNSDGQLTNNAIVEAGVNADSSRNTAGDVAIIAQSVRNNGTVIASRDLGATIGQHLDNSGHQIRAERNLNLNVQGTVNNQKGELVAVGNLTAKGSKLDNRAGGLVGATQALNLDVADIDNRSGKVSGSSQVDIKAGLLTNTDGTLSGQTDLSIALSGDLNNGNGRLSSEGTLNIAANHLINTAGKLSSAGALKVVTSGAVTNQQGSISTESGLTLTSASLDNQNQGLVSGKHETVISTRAVDNSHGGELISDRLTLTATHVINQDKGRIAAAKHLTASVTGLDQQHGKLISNGTLSLDLNNGQLNNQNGLINSSGTLLLNNLASVNNQNGELSSSLDFTFNADRLDNSNGKLLSNQALIVRVAQALTNIKGTIAAASLDAQSGTLINRGGTLNSRGDLTLNVDGLLSNDNEGVINAARTLDLQATGISNISGTLQANSSLNLDLNGADLDNTNGRIGTQSPLTIKHLRDLKNANGEISSSQSFSLDGRTLDNGGGKLISNQMLTLNADSLLNRSGLISGWNGVDASGRSLDNRAGTLSSRDSDLSVSLTGALLNGDAGALASLKTLSITSASIDNRGGTLSSGAGQTYNISAVLDNSQKGVIESGTTLILQAAELRNATGTINAQQDMSFIGTDLDNSAGTIAGNAAVTLDLLGKLTNTNGKLAGAGDLLIQHANQVSNHGGQLVSQRAMTLFTGELDNSHRGTVAANDHLLLTANGAIQNANDGLIYSKGAGVAVQSASLTNSKGTLQSQGTLNLTVAGGIDNQSGKIIAQGGDLNITANNLDNRGGKLSSLQEAFTARITGVLKNGYALNHQGGITQAHRLDIRALAGIDNQGGSISAQTGDALIDVGSGNFDNRNGRLSAKQWLSVTGNNFESGGSVDGQVAGQKIDLTLKGALNNRLGVIESDSSLNITAASLDNHAGTIRDLGTTGVTRFQIGGLLDNRNGTLETANTDLALGAGRLLNAGGTVLHVGRGNFGISTADVMNAGGSFVTSGALTLNANSWVNSSVLQAGTLNVNVGNFTQTASGQLLASTALIGTGGNWTNDGLIVSDGTLSLSLGGTYAGNGRTTSLGALSIGANQLSLGNEASITGGGHTAISVAGQATSHGRITSTADLVFNAGGVSNYGTLGAAQNLTLTTPALANNQGLTFSGSDMQLNTSTLSNLKGDFYSLRNLTIGGYGTRRANQVSNISGSMESRGEFAIDATAFENRTETSDGIQNYAVGRTLVKGFIAVQCLDCKGDYFDVNYIVRETFDAGQESDTRASALTAGGDFTFTGSSFLNSKSTMSAGGNISIQADNVKNIGAMDGTIEHTRTYYQGRTSVGQKITDGTVKRFMSTIMDYNQRNNPDFPNIYYVASNNDLKLGVVSYKNKLEIGLDRTHVIKATVEDAGSNANVTNLTLHNYRHNSAPSSHYDPGDLLPLPEAFGRMALVSDIQVASDGTGNTGRSAVIQAGGKVSITATKELLNSVIREDYALAGGTNKVADTHAGGTGKTVVVRLSAQLPPDLAQQQVDPTNLPGFSLPMGQNGLFRLSRESGTKADVAPQNWSIGGASIIATQRDRSLPGYQPQDVVISSVSAPKAAGQLLTVAGRQGAGVTADASTIGVAADAQGLTRVQGLPSYAAKPGTGNYLIETNPVLTDLKQFMSSDYLLSALGYSPDKAQKRLGDGFYEQRLVQQAVTARTGQAFIGGQTSNENQFKYLMSNAIASKDALDLSVGVSLSSEQVAALTHDIVWLEEREINGERVLVPVLYLAQVNNRLAPNGALIAGNDVTLIAGENLDNVGTLKATRDLSAIAGKILLTSGLVEAGNRLDLLAGNHITNKAGGIIAGRDVTVTAIGGDVTNKRTITALNSDTRGQLHKDYADTAARIEAANDLSISAGRDLNNIGSVLQSGRDLTLNARRDANIASTHVVNSLVFDSKHKSSDITQLMSTLRAGRDLSVQAGRDLNAIASQIDAKRDIAIGAAENVTITSAADESHFLSKRKKLKLQKDHVHQVSTDINAGGSVAVSAGQNLSVISSRITAGDEAYLVAGDKLDILAAQDSDYSLYHKKKKGSFGKKKTKRDEVTQATNIGSEITSGGDTVLVSGGNQHYQVAKLNSGNDLTLNSGGTITLEGVKDLHQESHQKSKSSFAWKSMSGKGRTDETLRQSELIAIGNLAIQAVNGLHIDVKQVNRQTVSEAIDAMVSASPELAWLKEAEKRGDVDWRQVQENHQSFKYSHSGLGMGTQLVLAIALAAVTGGAGAGLIGAASGTSTAAIANAAFVSLEVTAANSAISNEGDPRAVVKDTFSKDGVQNAAVSGLTAGFINYASSDWFGASMDPSTGKITDPSVVPSFGDPAALGRFSAVKLAGGTVNGALSEATGTGTFKDSMMSSVFNVLQATAFNGAGDLGKKYDLPDSGAAKIAVHAVIGGLLSEVMGGDFKTGAAAAGANEALIEYLDTSEFLKGPDATKHDRMVNAASKLVGLFAAAAVDGDISVGSEIAGNAQSYNRKLHTLERKLLATEAEKLEQQGKTGSGLSWKSLLNLVAGADIDATDAASLKAILSTASDGNPEKMHLQEDLQLVESVIQRLRSEKIQLSWSDGAPIVAHGDEVYAFASSAAQYNDSNLFKANLANPTSTDELSAIPVAWAKQFGFAAAHQYQDEIGFGGTFAWETRDLRQNLATVLGGGIVPVPIDQEFLLMMAGGWTQKAFVALMGQRGAARLVGEGAEDIIGNVGAKGAGSIASISGRTCVYSCVIDGVTRYVGITDDLAKRGQAHLREKGIVISKIRGLDKISRADARVVEQTLIDYHGLGKDGGTLINKINSISSVKNPTKYEQGLIRGAELLKKAGYKGF